MLEIKIEKSFKKDIQRDKNIEQYSKKDFKLLKSIILKLQKEDSIEVTFKRHLLKGNMKDLESIHIKGDWLLVFFIDNKFLNLVMLGKHTQVYKKFKQIFTIQSGKIQRNRK